MPTARFSHVVEKCGEPETYLLLMDPAKDRTFQAAMKSHRVMTVFQESVGTKADRGEVGFAPGRARQFLVFPKSLQRFSGKNVVGIKYNLFGGADAPAPAKKPTLKSAIHTPKSKTKPRPARPLLPPRKAKESSKVVPFKAEPKEEQEDDDEVDELKKQVRHAMRILEEGKAVAAFNLLKRIVGD